MAAGAGPPLNGANVRALQAHARTCRIDPCYRARALGVAERGILALVNEERLRRILSRMLDENEFLSPYGIRALSRYHAEHPYSFGWTARNIG